MRNGRNIFARFPNFLVLSDRISSAITRRNVIKLDVKADTQIAMDATTTRGSSTVSITSSAIPFQCPGSVFPCSAGGDARKVVFAVEVQGVANPPFAPKVICPRGKIDTVNSATSVTLAASGCTRSGAAMLVWGSDDPPNIASAWDGI